jgi:hypothetical protein
MRPVVAVIAALACLGGCAKKSAGYSWEESAPQSAAAVQNLAYEDAEIARNEPPALVIAAESGRKLATTASLEIRLDDLEAGAAKLDSLVKKYGAYASSVRVHDVIRRYQLKVPAARLKPFMDEAMALGKVLNYSETTEDVTLRYVDMESRLQTRRELLKTYQGYLAKAKNIEEILSVESRIANLQAEIDTADSQFRALNNAIDYSTVDVELLGPVTASQQGRLSIGERAKELLSGAGGYMSTMAVVLLGLVVYGIPTALVASALFWLLFGKIGLLKKLFRIVSEKKKP